MIQYPHLEILIHKQRGIIMAFTKKQYNSCAEYNKATLRVRVWEEQAYKIDILKDLYPHLAPSTLVNVIINKLPMEELIKLVELYQKEYDANHK